MDYLYKSNNKVGKNDKVINGIFLKYGTEIDYFNEIKDDFLSM